MAIIKSAEAAQILLYQICYFIFRQICIWIQSVVQQFNGVAEHRRRVMSGEDKSGLVAEVCTVKCVLPHVVMSAQDHYHFSLWHSTFVKLDYLLRPEVTLYALDDSTAVFVECPADLDVYDTTKFPFFFMAQQDNCTNVIIVPLREFLRLNDRIEKPKCKVVWIIHPGRCCSTVLAQAMNPIPKCKVIAETSFMIRHLALVDIKCTIPLDDYLVSERFYNIGEAAIRFMLKDFSLDNQVIWKCVGIFDLSFIPLIDERFPQHKVISIHRDGLHTCKSFYKAYSDHVAINMAAFMLNYSIPKVISKSVLDPILFIFTNGMRKEVEHHFKTMDVDVFQLYYWRWMTHMLRLRQYHKLGLIKNLRCFVYEDFQQDMEGTLTKVYEYLDIPLDHLPLSMTAVARDSQRGTVLDRSKVNAKPAWQREEVVVKACNSILQQYNLPAFDEKFRFDENCNIHIF